MFAPAGYVSPAQIAEAVDRAVSTLGPEVVRVRYSVHEDHAGDPAIHFRIVLADWAVNYETLAQVSRKITNHFFNELHPIENWGLYPYFRFRSNSEYTRDPEWA